jgi:hypothetical protein
MHSVTDDRPTVFLFTDSSSGFLELHGKDLHWKCVIVTTVGSDLPPSAREGLEKSLKAMWKGMMDCGLHMTHFDGTHQSAWVAVYLLVGDPAMHFGLQVVPPAVSPRVRLDGYLLPQNAGEVTSQNEAVYPHLVSQLAEMPCEGTYHLYLEIPMPPS